MKVIKEGKIPLKKEWLKKCKRCKTVFLYDESDKKVLGLCPDDWHYGVKCPFCNSNLLTSIFDKKIS